MSEHFFPAPTQQPRTPGDQARELEADAAFVEGKWEAWHHSDLPEIEKNLASKAIQGVEESEESTQPASTPVEAAGFTKSESGLLVPDENYDKVTMMDSAPMAIKDNRRFSPASIEADFQAKQEALNAPLSNQDLSKVADKLITDLNGQIEVLKTNKTEGKLSVEAQDLEGDKRALARIKQFAEGGYAAVGGNDDMNRDKGMPINERFASLAKVFDRFKNIDFKTGQIHYGGSYDGFRYYEFARAEQLYNALQQEDPRNIRETVLLTDQVQYPDALKQPLVATPEASFSL